MPITSADLEELRRKLDSARRAKRLATAQARVAEALEILRGKTAAEAGTTAVAPPDEDGLGFADFFAEVGRGMADTQDLLDSRSDAYLRGIRDRPFLQPTVFRMARVKGNLKLGLHKGTEKGANLLVYLNKTKETQLTEHEVEFELAAAPPPPEALQKVQELRAALALVLAPGERREVFAAVAACLDPGSDAGAFDDSAFPRSHAQAALGGAGPEVLVYETGASGAEGRQSLVLVARYGSATSTPREHIGAWHLSLVTSGSAPHGLTPLWRVPKTQAQFAALDALLRAATDEQAALLAGAS